MTVDHEGFLCLRGERLPDAREPREALELFLAFLRRQLSEKEDKVVLVAHNGIAFDSKILVNSFNR